MSLGYWIGAGISLLIFICYAIKTHTDISELQEVFLEQVESIIDRQVSIEINQKQQEAELKEKEMELEYQKFYSWLRDFKHLGKGTARDYYNLIKAIHGGSELKNHTYKSALNRWKEFKENDRKKVWCNG